MIPSNILIAFKKSKIHNKVKNNENFLSSIGASRNEKDNSLIIRFSSIIKTIKIIIELEISLVLAEILCLSSSNPIIKHNDKPKKKEKYSLQSLIKKTLLYFTQTHLYFLVVRKFGLVGIVIFH